MTTNKLPAQLERHTNIISAIANDIGFGCTKYSEFGKGLFIVTYKRKSKFTGLSEIKQVLSTWFDFHSEEKDRIIFKQKIIGKYESWIVQVNYFFDNDAITVAFFKDEF